MTKPLPEGVHVSDGARAHAKPALELLRQFLVDPGVKRSRWLQTHALDVYVRIGFLSMAAETKVGLVIANIETNAQYRGEGVATVFLWEAHQLNNWPITIIHTASDPLGRIAQRLGFSPIEERSELIDRLFGADVPRDRHYILVKPLPITGT